MVKVYVYFEIGLSIASILPSAGGVFSVRFYLNDGSEAFK